MTLASLAPPLSVAIPVLRHHIIPAPFAKIVPLLLVNVFSALSVAAPPVMFLSHFQIPEIASWTVQHFMIPSALSVIPQSALFVILAMP